MADRQADETERSAIGTNTRRTVLGAIGAAASVATGLVTASDRGAARSAGGRDRTPRLTAHRGFADVYPENTVAAVEGAARYGADRIEIDVQPTADGEIVVFHDEHLEDLTDESGRVADASAETVCRAEVLDSGETVPTLREVLEAARPSVAMNVEFKAAGEYSWSTVAERTLEIASDFSGEFYVSSFETAALEAVRGVDPAVPIAKLFGANPAENLEIARELEAEAINPSLDVLDDDLVATAHEEGRDVNVYTIDSWREARRPLELHVDSLIADYPSVLAFGTGARPGPDRGR